MRALHSAQYVDGIELAAGLLLLANRYVPPALVVLAAAIANMFWFHLSLQPQGLPAPLILTAPWIVVARSRRADLAPLLAR